jgi:hypothetical protein
MFNWMNAFSGVTKSPVTVPLGGRQKPASLDNAFSSFAQFGNDALDRAFYNVEESDFDQVATFSGEQGSIVYVPAKRSAPLEECADATELFEKHPDVGAISVAGVGSSAVGAAGLARDVADATGLPVAAVVSGSGALDVVWQGMGGWMFLREDNQLEFFLEKTRNAFLAAGMVPGFVPWIDSWDSIGSGPDTVTLKSLLRKDRLKKLKWVVGHSKGNLVISSAISELVLEEGLMDMKDVDLVLLSAVTALPPDVGRQHQYLGALDVLGMVNSRLAVPYESVPGATHTLNRQLPFHLDAVAEIKKLAALRPDGPKPEGTKEAAKAGKAGKS